VRGVLGDKLRLQLTDCHRVQVQKETRLATHVELFVNRFFHLRINTTYLGTNSASFLPSRGKETKKEREAAAPEPFPLG